MPYDAKVAADNARFVQFVYNMYGNGESLNPAPDPGLAEEGYDLLLTLTAKDAKSVKFYGFIAAPAADHGDLILAIRGTEDFTEWLLDFNAAPLPYLGMGFVAAGFRSIADSFSLTDATGAAYILNDAITKLDGETAITSLTILGHSLGSALATLAAAQLASQNPANVKDLITVWTYASPRVGLLDFMNNYNKDVPNTYRIWNDLDLVPGVPVFPYVHVGGNGEELKQTQAQMNELDTTPSCEHHLATYQWLIDSADFAIPAACEFQQSGLALAAVAEPQGIGARRAVETVPDEHAQGIEAMFQAMQR
jgi:hypothetical protein